MMRRSTASRSTLLMTCGLLAAGVLAGTATAQTRVGDLKETDAGVSDAGPINRSLRQLNPDLRLPTQFEDVYDVGRHGLKMRGDGGLFAVFRDSEYEQSSRGLVPLIPSNTVFFIGAPSAEAIDRYYGQLNGPPAPRMGVTPNDERAPRRINPEIFTQLDSGRILTALDEEPDNPSVVGPPEPNPEVSAAPRWNYRSRLSSWQDMPDVDLSVSTIMTDELYRDARVRRLLRAAASEQ